MPMQLTETKILPDSIQMRYADNPDPIEAGEWCEFRVKLAGLPHPMVQGQPRPLGDPDLQFLSEVRLAALRRVRVLIDAENQRLSNLAGRTNR
jgi:hypothetical protein